MTVADPVSSVAFGCSCGNVRGTVSPATKRSGTHLVCHCADCRAAQRYFGQPDPAPDGVQIFQTTPDTISFEQGLDRLGLFRLGPKGTCRWYATCCNAPLFNTLANPRLPFAGLLVARVDDPAPLGPVVAQASLPQKDGTSKHKNGTMMVWRIFRRLAAARLSGRWRQTPFFDPDSGTPVAEATIPTRQDRAALYLR